MKTGKESEVKQRKSLLKKLKERGLDLTPPPDKKWIPAIGDTVKINVKKIQKQKDYKKRSALYKCFLDMVKDGKTADQYEVTEIIGDDFIVKLKDCPFDFFLTDLLPAEETNV